MIKQNIYSLSVIAKIVDGKLIGNNYHIKDLLIDSRNSIINDMSLFVAINGLHHDGHQYIVSLYERGIYAFMTEQMPKNLPQNHKASFVLVDNTLRALQKLAAFHRQKFTSPVVGITGSNGKTIVKEWIFQALEGQLSLIRSPRSYNSQVGVPLSVWNMSEHHKLAVFEAGISQPAEMQHLEPIISPQIGIFTNIGNAHQANFESTKQKINEKLQLFKNADVVIHCADHELITKQINTWCSAKSVAWSVHRGAFIYLKNTEITGSTSKLNIVINDRKSINIEIPFTDAAGIENAMHVITFLAWFETGKYLKPDKLAALSAVAMRMELKAGINNCVLVNDSYNSDINSIKIALDFIHAQQYPAKKTLLISDIIDNALDLDELYENLATIIRKKPVHRFIGIGKEIGHFAQKFGFVQNREFYKSTSDFIKNMTNSGFSDELILIKGARKFHFEHISDKLELHKHRTVLTINMNALIHNLNYFRNLLSPATKILVMVKAFSYGNGSYEIAGMLQHQRIDYLGVAYPDEGVHLRKAGITLPILVLNPPIESYSQLITYNLEPEIYRIDMLRAFRRAALATGHVNYPVHLKIDTGMRRLGFCEADLDLLLQELENIEGIKIRSVFSHLVAGEDQQEDAFTKKQIADFEQISQQISKKIGYIPIRHIANSAAIERFPQAHFDMVRLGIGLYGISAENEHKLQSISSLKTHVSQIKTLKKGDTIGYNRKGIMSKDGQIAIVPIGYADGLSRSLSNGVGKMWVNGKFAPIIGNICMDMCMLDVSDLSVLPNDEVLVFGDEFTISQLANLQKTIPYEILTSISPRVKRIYVQE